MKKAINVCFVSLVGLGILFGSTKVSAIDNATQRIQGRSVLSVCDTNGNGTVDLMDVNTVLKYALTIESYEDKTANGDVDQDGRVTLSDVNMVLKYALTILEIPTETPVDSDIPSISPSPTPTNTASPTPTPTPIPTETEKAYMEPNAQLLKEHNKEIYNTVRYEILTQWASENLTEKEAEEKANVIVRELCGVVYHVKWFPYNKESDLDYFWNERIRIANEGGFSSYTMQVIGREDKGWFLVYF